MGRRHGKGMTRRSRNTHSSGAIIEITRGNQIVKKPGIPRYIAVSGNIGAGKSSLVEYLCKVYHAEPLYEPNDTNPYLVDFYKDMNRWSFASQVFFLGAKYRLHQSITNHPESLIQDRTIWEDAEIFAKNLYQQGAMSERDYSTYSMIYETMRGSLRHPDLMIYLRCPVRSLKRRIMRRGRISEREIPIAYLRNLDTLYEEWIEGYTLSPIVILPIGRLDYVEDLLDRYEILTLIDRILDRREDEG